MEFHSCLSSFPVYCLITVRICVPHRQYGFAFAWKAGEDERPFRLWPLPFFPLASGSWLKLHEFPVEDCPCAFHWKHSNTFISPQALILFWLSATDPRSTTSFRILKFQFLIIWSSWSFAPVFKCWWFSGPLFLATSWSNKAITIWSWTEFCDFDIYNPSRIDGKDISPTVKSAWSHRTSKSWISSSFCKLIVEPILRVLVLLQRLTIAWKNSKIMYAICLPRKNWSEFSAAALRHFLLFGRLTACRDASSRLTQSSREANRN